MSTIKTDRIEPLGTTIVVSSGITVGGGAHFSGGITAAGGLSVTGGIAGTLVTAAQPNITSLGTLSSLNVSAFGNGNIAPLPTSSSGVGQVININAGSYTLPSEGTWFYFAFRWNTTSVQDSVGGIAAGGTLVCPFFSGQAWEGFAWRIT